MARCLGIRRREAFALERKDIAALEEYTRILTAVFRKACRRL